MVIVKNKMCGMPPYFAGKGLGDLSSMPVIAYSIKIIAKAGGKSSQDALELRSLRWKGHFQEARRK